MKNKYTFNKNFFNRIDTEEKAYILGFLYADGNISDTIKDRHYRLRILLKDSDSDILEKIKKSIDFTGNISHREQKYQDKNKCGYKISDLAIHSKTLHTQLMKHGLFPGKTFNIKYPNIPEELDRHFIRGFFDGDGSIYLRKNRPNGFRINLTCASKEFLDEISKKIITNTKIKNCNINPTKNMYRFDKDKNDAIRILNWLYENSNIYLNRKYEMYKQVKMSLLEETPRVERAKSVEA